MSFFTRIASAARPGRLRREIEAEQRFHLEARMSELMDRGEGEASARRRAAVAFGAAERWREGSQEAKSAGWLADALADSRYAWRTMRRQPGFALAAVLSLALGLGAVTAVFSAVNGALLHGQPYPQPEQLQNVWMLLPPSAQIGTPYNPWSRPIFWQLVATETGPGGPFQTLGAYVPATYNLTGRGAPVRLNAVQATAGVWTALRAQPAMGRVYTEAEDRPGRGQVVVLSDRTWRGVFQADPRIVGQTIELSGLPYTVIGVMPPGFAFPDTASMPPTFDFTAPAQIWVPAALSHGPVVPFENNSLAVVGRLRDGVTQPQAASGLRLWTERWEKRYPRSKGWFNLRLQTLQAAATEGLRGPLWLLLLAVAMVLLVACSNVAGLLISRSLARQPEFALRAALGAGRRRLARQLLTEALWLALLGGVLGAGCAVAALAGLAAFLADAVPRLASVALDWRVFAFSAAATLASGLLCALAPIAALPRMRMQGRSVAATPKFRSALVAAQVALALVLAVVGGLLSRSLGRLLAAGGGFDPTAAVSAQISLPSDRYATIAQQAAFYESVRRNLHQNPEIVAAGVALVAPLDGDSQGNPILVPGRPVDPAHIPLVNYTNASAGYFAAAGIRLLRGRGFLDSDSAASEPVTVVNQALAAKIFPGASAVGQHIRVPIDKLPKLIVGVVENPKHDRMDEAPAPEMYVPITQNPWPPMQIMALVVRARPDADGALPAHLRAAVVAAVHAVDPDVPVSDWQPLQALVAHAVAPARFVLLLLTGFALLTLLLAAVGLYAVMAYAVAQRSRELGVRMALGASRGSLFAMVLRQGAALAGVGLAAGWLLAVAVAELLRGYLFGVAPLDPLTLTLAPLTLAVVALAACLLPARRAARLDPLAALRLE